MDKLRYQLSRLTVRSSKQVQCIFCNTLTSTSDHGLCARCFTNATSDAFTFETPSAEKIAECAVCFYDITDADPADIVFMCPGCLTIFHHPCLETWWRRTGVNRCPTCNIDTAHVDEYMNAMCH